MNLPNTNNATIGKLLSLSKYCALFTIFIGSVVLLGWFFHYEPVVTLYVSRAAMQFNTALGMVLLGLTTFAFIYQYRNILLFSVLSLLLLSGMSLAQYAFNVNIGIDQLFFVSWLEEETLYPGRMSFNTAFCFFVGGIGVLAKFISRKPLNRKISRAGISLVFLVSSLAILGYIADLDATIGWNNWSYMAIHTALGFSSFSCAFALLSLSQLQHWKSIPVFWLAALGFAVPFLLFITLWQKNVDSGINQKKVAAIAQTELQAANIENRMNSIINSLIRMRERWEVTNGEPIDLWERDAVNYVKHQSSLEDLFLLGNHSQIKQHVTLITDETANEKIDQVETFMQNDVLNASSLVLSDLFAAKNNQSYILVYLPFNSQAIETTGVVGVYNISTTLQEIMASQSNNSMSVYFNDVLIFTNVNHSDEQSNNMTAVAEESLSLFGTRWHIKTSIYVNIRGQVSNWSFISGLLLSVAIGLLVYFFFASLRRNHVLEVSEKRFRSVIETAVDGFIIIDMKGCINTVNPTVTTLFCYQEEELIGENIKMLMPSPYHDKHDGYLSDYVKTGQKKIIGSIREVEALRKDKSTFSVELSITEFHFEGERMFFGFLRDITQRKQTEQKLIESETRYELAIQGAGVGIWDWYEVSGKELFWSEQFLKLLGYKLGELDVDIDTFAAALHPDDQQSTWDAINAHFNEHKPYNTEFRLKCKDGAYKWFRGTGKATFNSDGKALRMVGSVEDIQAINDLQQQQNRLIEILQNSTDYIGQIDKEHNIVFLNNAFKELTGTEDLKAASLHNWHSNDSLEKLRKHIEPETIKHGIWEGTLDLIDKDGRCFPVSMVHIAHKNWKNEIEFYSAIFRDISLQKQYEDDLIALKEKAEQANSAKGNFLANMSHEIRTPMNGIIGLTNLILQMDLGAKQYDYLTKIKSASHSLLNILNDILDYSKIEAGKFELFHKTFDMETLLTNTAGIFSFQAANKKLEFLINNQCNSREYVGDDLRIGQVLQNLIGNAIKFTETGMVKVLITDQELDGGKVSLSFVVSDTGIGMTREQVMNLFNAFSQADNTITRKFGGTGLGLSISQRLVKLMDGNIEVISLPGEGSTFAFQVIVDKSQKKHSLPQPAKKYRTLVVDDNPVSLTVFEGILSSWGFDFDMTDSPIQALAMLETACQKDQLYELLIVDWKMPTLDGLQLIDIIKNDIRYTKQATTLSILMVTGYSHELIEHKHNRGKPDIIIEKPLLASNLYDAIVDNQNIVHGTNESVTSSPVTNDGSVLVGKRVLLVEDNKTNQIVALDFLKQLGLETFVTENGHEAIDFLQKTAVDIVLMDIQMPVMDGLEATRLIRANDAHCDLPIVAMSAAAMISDKQKCLEVGMNDHIAKPVDFSKLQTTLVQYLADDSVQHESTISNETSPEDNVAESISYIDLPGFDMDSAFDRLSNNLTLLQRVVEQYLTEIPNYIETMHSAQNSQDDKTLFRLFHTLKSASATVGAERLSQLCIDAEKHPQESQDYCIQIEKELNRSAEVFSSLQFMQETIDAKSTNQPQICLSNHHSVQLYVS